MEDRLSHAVWAFRIHCYAVRSNQCTRSLSTHGEWYIQRPLGYLFIIYLDDLLIYSKTQEEHDSHVLLVLKRLRENGLYAKLEKCSFDCKQVEFLGYFISSKGISMDPAKVQTVLEWQIPRSVRPENRSTLPPPYHKTLSQIPKEWVFDIVLL